MRNILIGLLVVGIVNSSPIPDNSTQPFQTVSSTTEKIANEDHSTLAEKKGGKEIAPTTQSTTTKLTEYPKSVTENHPIKGSEAIVTTANKNEASTSQSHKEEPAITTSSNKAEIKDSTTSSVGLKGEPIKSLTTKKQEEKVPSATPSGPKLESTNASATNQKGPTTIKSDNGDKEKKSNQHSTAYLDKGKVVIFNGICGPDGCEIEGDIYDELVPLPHSKKQG